MVMRAHGHTAELADLRDLTATGRDGVSAQGMLAAVRHRGFEGRGVRCEPDRLDDLPSGAILHWAGNHFVVLVGRTRRGVQILDPALGRRVITESAFREQYSGVALLLAPRDEQGLLQVDSPVDEPARWQRYQHLVKAAKRPLLAALLLAAVVQGCALVYPLILRAVVDAAGRTAETASTATWSGSLLALAVGYLLAQIGRVLCLTAVQRVVDVRLTMEVLDHLASLPYTFVARRSVGDVALRVRSTFAVRQILTASALSAVLDGVLVLGYLLVIFVVDGTFGVLTVTAIGLQLGLVALCWTRLRQNAAEALDRQTAAQTELLEIVGGFETLKAAGAAQSAVASWSARLQQEVDAQVRSNRASGLIDSVLVTIRFATPPALLVLGLGRVASGSLALADMLALAALSVAVTVPVGALLSTVCSLTSVFSYVDRLDDLLSTSPEQQGDRQVPDRVTGALAVRGVSYRYSPLSQPAVIDVDVRIGAGEHVAIVGASGSGKTTLALLLASLYDPSAGTITLDGHPVRNYDRDALRGRVGVVAQGTALFSATIRDNIILGRAWLSDADVTAAAGIAQLHADVQQLPSGYDTLLGNGGTGLSGGQRQRVALARALAGNPGLLILDEATSALDAATERKVQQAIQQLDCTRITIAHRLTAAALADRVLVMQAGEVVADGTYASLRRRSPVFRAMLEADGRLRVRSG